MSQNRERGLTKLERLEMRRELFSSITRGSKLTAACEDIVKKYQEQGIHVTFNALRKDWSRRDKWLPLLAKLEDEQNLVSSLMLEMQEARVESWRLYEQARESNNENAAVGVLKAIGDSICNQFKLLQSLGKIYKAATTVQGVETGPPIQIKIWRPPGIPENGLLTNPALRKRVGLEEEG